jgi:uncharacterized protein YndB with AHSA1/START domain
VPGPESLTEVFAPLAVYDALVDPEALVVWLPPEGMSGRFEWFELRNGGGCRLVLKTTPGRTAL